MVGLWSVSVARLQFLSYFFSDDQVPNNIFSMQPTIIADAEVIFKKSDWIGINKKYFLKFHI